MITIRCGGCQFDTFDETVQSYWSGELEPLPFRGKVVLPQQRSKECLTPWEFKEARRTIVSTKSGSISTY